MRGPNTGTVSMRILARFMLSGERPDALPSPRSPEIAFSTLERRKSSLINTLVARTGAHQQTLPDAHGASIFMRSRAGNRGPRCFSPTSRDTVTAKISREISDDWARFVDPYLHQRSSLPVFGAGRRQYSSPGSDGNLLEFLTSKERPYALVATSATALRQPTGANDARARRSLWRRSHRGVFGQNRRRQGRLWAQIRASLSLFPPV